MEFFSIENERKNRASISPERQRSRLAQSAWWLNDQTNSMSFWQHTPLALGVRLSKEDRFTAGCPLVHEPEH